MHSVYDVLAFPNKPKLTYSNRKLWCEHGHLQKVITQDAQSSTAGNCSQLRYQAAKLTTEKKVANLRYHVKEE